MMQKVHFRLTSVVPKRCCLSSVISTHRRLLLPQPVDQDHVLKTLHQRQRNAKSNYDKQSRDLPPLKVGDKLPFRPNDEREWRKAEVMPRLYMLEDEYERGYRINRRQIISVPNDSPMTPRTRAPPLRTQPCDSSASTRQKLASSQVTLQRQAEAMSHTPLQSDVGVKLRGRKDSLNCVRG